MALVALGFLASVSFALGLYFRVAEYDVLASDKVWDRIGPAARGIVDDETIPDLIAGDLTAFATIAGCGCFTNVMLLTSIRRLLRVGGNGKPSEEFVAAILSLTEEQRHAVFGLMTDLIIFDSLHAPILGRLCRALNRQQLSRRRYRVSDAAECENTAIAKIGGAAESVLSRPEYSDLVPCAA